MHFAGMYILGSDRNQLDSQISFKDMQLNPTRAIFALDNSEMIYIF